MSTIHTIVHWVDSATGYISIFTARRIALRQFWSSVAFTRCIKTAERSINLLATYHQPHCSSFIAPNTVAKSLRSPSPGVRVDVHDHFKVKVRNKKTISRKCTTYKNNARIGKSQMSNFLLLFMGNDTAKWYGASRGFSVTRAVGPLAALNTNLADVTSSSSSSLSVWCYLHGRTDQPH